MQLIRFCLDNRVKVTVGALLLILFGTVSLWQMPVQLAPEVQRPEIRVRTRWAAASAHEIEREIVQPQEDQLKRVPGVLKSTSYSRDGAAQITLEFAPDADMQEALVNANNRLAQVKEYPVDADEPVVTSSTSSERPIAYLVLIATGDDIDVTEYGKFAEDYIAAALERVTGVADVTVSGGREPEMRVIVDPVKLAAHGLTIGDVQQALTDQNRDTSSGAIWEGRRRYTLRTRGQYNTPEQVEATVIAYDGQAPVYVKDVGNAQLGYKKLASLARRKGHSAIMIRVIREVKANELEVLKRIEKVVASLNQQLLNKRNLQLNIAHDKRPYIYSAIGLVTNNLYVGGSLTILILFCFLRSARSTAIICLSMPISIIGTFLMMHAMGRTMNVISLAGIAFATGMVVDNAVVVLENIDRHWRNNKRPFEAALHGTREVWGAVLAATLTTLVVYIPVILIPQEAGQLFRDIAIANSCAVSLSWVVSITMIPVAATYILKSQTPKTETQPVQGRLRQLITSLTPGLLLRGLVVQLNQALQRSATARILTVLAFVSGSVLVCWLTWPEIEYLPAGNRRLAMATMVPAPGLNTQELTRVLEQCEQILQPFWETTADSGSGKQLDGPAIADQFSYLSSRSGELFLGARTVDMLKGAELVPILTNATARIPGLQAKVRQLGLFGGRGGRSIYVEITGPDLPRLVEFGERVQRTAIGALEGASVIPQPALDLTSPELHVIPRREVAARVGLTARELGYWIDALNDGAYAGSYWQGTDKIDLTILAGNDEIRKHGDAWDSRLVAHTQQLAEMPISTPQGQLVTVGSVADIRFSGGPELVFHSERQRAVRIEVTPRPDVPLERAANVLQTQMDSMLSAEDIENGYQIRLSGAVDKLLGSWDAMKWNLLLALLVTYLLMAGLFESWAYPAVIMISVPPAAVGGLFGLWLLNQSVVQHLDMLTMLGFVTLIGIVVNNAILIVHQTLNLLRTQHLPHAEAIVESVRSRVRPIFMTTITTMCGLAPLVLSPGAGSELYRGLGSIVLGGLGCSTLFTLILVPTLLRLLLDIRQWMSGGFNTPSIETHDASGAEPASNVTDQQNVGTVAP